MTEPADRPATEPRTDKDRVARIVWKAIETRLDPDSADIEFSRKDWNELLIEDERDEFREIAAAIEAEARSTPAEALRCGRCGITMASADEERKCSGSNFSLWCAPARSTPAEARSVSDKRLDDLWAWAKKHAMLRDQGGLPATVFDLIEEVRIRRSTPSEALDVNRLTAIIESRMSRDLAWLDDDGKTVNRFGPEQVAHALLHLYRTGDVVSGLPPLSPHNGEAEER